ncbi:uncharacterized protein LOC144249027 isoform X1 [Urocitellus parryii]
MATRPAARGRPCALLPPSAAEPGPASLATAAASMVGARSLQRRAGAPGRVRSSGDVGTAGSAHSGEETARRIRCARCHGTSAAFFLGVSGDLRIFSGSSEPTRKKKEQNEQNERPCLLNCLQKFLQDQIHKFINYFFKTTSPRYPRQKPTPPHDQFLLLQRLCLHLKPSLTPFQE